MKKFLSIFDTISPLGVIRAMATQKGIYEIKINQRRHRETASPDKRLKAFQRWLKRYLLGEEKAFRGTLDLSWASGFDKKVYKNLLNVQCGRVTTYARLARSLGKAGAFRAVGNSLAKNRLPIVIPCHRVISSDGSLGGYSGGLKIKKFLLQLEKDI